MKRFIIPSILGLAVLVLFSPGFLRADAAPKPTTLPASAITSTSATLNGKIDPGGLRTDIYFISCDPTLSPSFFAQTHTQWTDGTTVKIVSETLTGLKPGTTYRYALTSSNSKGVATAPCLTFTTAAAPPPPQGTAPTVTTLPATEVTSATAALNATVNPNGLTTTVQFKSCSSANEPQYFPPTSSKTLAAGNTPQSVGLRLSGLKPGLTYQYAITATNSAGHTPGNCIAFTTPGGPATGKPAVETRPASNIGTTSATLNGSVNPNGLTTNTSFASGETDVHSLGFFPVTAQKAAGSGTSSLNVTAHVSGLLPGTPYKYKIQAKNSAGEVVGAFVTFTTARASGPPTVETNPPQSILGTSAILEGAVNPNGSETEWFFISCDDIHASNYFAPTLAVKEYAHINPYIVSAQINGLKPKTAYRYAIKATNSQGTKTGKCVTFTTLIAQAARPKVTTSPAGSIDSKGAWLKGSVNPNGLDTTFWFESCATSSVAPDYFPKTLEQSVGSGIAPVEASKFVAGLFPGQTYKFRIGAKNRVGSSVGECMTFTTTGTTGITVQTLPPQSVTSTTALLSAKVNPNGINTTVGFKCSTPASGCFQNVPNQGIGYLKGSQVVLQIVDNLKPSTTYCYSARAWGPDGKEVPGGSLCFTTPASTATGPPTAITQAAQNIASNGVEFRAIVSANGLPTTYYFESCLNFPTFPATKPKNLGSLINNIIQVGGVTGLTPNTTYQYRVVAKNSKGTVKGECMTFKTSHGAPLPSSGGAANAEDKTERRRVEFTTK